MYHYLNTTQYDRETRKGGLFAPFMDKFLKDKTEASGYPDGVDTDEEKAAFIVELYDKEGIEMDPELIEYNPVRRGNSKVCTIP